MLFLYLKLALAVSVIFFIGLEALALMNRGTVKFALLEKLAISYALGSGLITSLFLMLYVVNLPTSIGFLCAIILIVLAGGFFAVTKICGPVKIGSSLTDIKDLFGKFKTLALPEWLLVIGIMFKSGFVFAEAMIKPVFSWDAVANHSIRAKALYLYSSGIIGHFLTDFRLTQTFVNDYPMQRSILEAWFYKCMGTWNDQLSKIMYPLMFMVLLMFFYSVVRRLAPRLYALFFTLLLSTVPLFVYHATLEYVDLSVTFYFTFAAFTLYLWSREGRASYFLLSAAFAGILPTVKAEGVALCLVLYALGFCSLLIREKDLLRSSLKWAVYFAVSFPLYIWWFLFVRMAHLKTFWQFKDLAASAILERFSAYSQAMNKGLFIDGNWNLAFTVLFVLLSVNLLFNFKMLKGKGSFFLVSVLFLFFGYLTFVYSFTGGFDTMGININRVCLSMIPLSLLIIADQFMILKNSVLANNGKGGKPSMDGQARN